MSDTNHIKIITAQAAKPSNIALVGKVVTNKTKDSDLFQVEQFGKIFMYKISDSHTAFRTLMLSQYLLANNIPVPDSKIFINQNTYFEKYKMIPGITLSEWLLYDNLSQDKLEKILYETMLCEKRIAETKIPNKTIEQQLALHDVLKQHHKKDFGKVIANLCYIINKTRKPHGNITLRHADPNTSNILLDSNGNFKALLDLDGFALCDEYKMLSQILLFWPNISENKLIEIYESVFQQKLDKNYLQKLTNARKQKTKITTTLRKARTLIHCA